MLVDSNTTCSRRSLLVGAGAALVIAPVPFLHPGPAYAVGLAEKFSGQAAGATLSVDHVAWGALLAKHLKPGNNGGPMLVDYAGFKAQDRGALDSYLKSLQAVDVATLARPEQLAFWFNLYNAVTVAAILDAYPVKSIKDVRLGGSIKANLTGGPWDAKLAKVAGTELSLNDIEHQIVRPIAKDPRIHYAVNCASIGCPTLFKEPFAGTTLAAQLDMAARTYVNSPNGVSLDKGQVTLSSIYDWYADDFGDQKMLRKHLLQFADGERAEAIKKAKRFRYGYDWALNDAKPAA